jgi:hypothetical protein
MKTMPHEEKTEPKPCTCLTCFYWDLHDRRMTDNGVLGHRCMRQWVNCIEVHGAICFWPDGHKTLVTALDATCKYAVRRADTQTV